MKILFDGEPIDTNIVHTLSHLIKRNNCALFTGATISCYSPTGLPLGKELQKAVLEDVVYSMFRHPAGILLSNSSYSLILREMTDQRNLSPSLAPELVFAHIQAVGIDPIPFISLHIMLGREPNACHKRIAEMLNQGTFRYILTTNFDELIEKSANDKQLKTNAMNKNETLIQLSSNEIYKIHGTISDSRSMQATIQHIALGLSNSKGDVLTRILNTCDLLVIGYSGCDLDIIPFLVEEAKHSIVWLLRPRNQKPSIVKLKEITDDNEKQLAHHLEPIESRLTFISCDAYIFLNLLSVLSNNSHLRAESPEFLRDYNPPPYILSDVPVSTPWQVFEIFARLHLASGNIDKSYEIFKILFTSPYPLGLKDNKAEINKFNQIRNWLISIENLQHQLKNNPKLNIKDKLHDIMWGVPPQQFSTKFHIKISREEKPELTPEEKYYSLVQQNYLDDAIELYVNQLYENLFWQKADYQKCLDLLLLLFVGKEPKPQFEDKRWIALACNHRGLCHDKLGFPQEAHHFHLKELAIRKETTGYHQILPGMINLIDSEIELGQLRQAMQRIRDGFYIIDKYLESDSYYKPILYRSRGFIKTLLGQYKEGLTDLNKSIVEFKNLGSETKQSQSFCWCWIALNHSFQHDWNKAYEAISRAESLAQYEHLDVDLARVNLIHGFVHVQCNRNNEARELLSKAKNLCERHSLHQLFYWVEITNAFTQEYEDVINTAKIALKQCEDRGLRLREVEAHYLLGKLFKSKKQWDIALKHVDSSILKAKCGYYYFEDKAKELKIEITKSLEN